MSMRWLGNSDDAKAMFEAMSAFGDELIRTPAEIDYFATSLPDLLVFNDDLQKRRQIEGTVIQALANIGLDEFDEAKMRLERVMEQDPANPVARMFTLELENIGLEQSILWSVQPTAQLK